MYFYFGGMLKTPTGEDPHGSFFVDGFRLDAEHDLYGFCARQGWSLAAYESRHELLAAANGRTPAWAVGIHATELWGLLMATMTATPWNPLKVDFQAVQKGAQMGVQWANPGSLTHT